MENLVQGKTLEITPIPDPVYSPELTRQLGLLKATHLVHRGERVLMGLTLQCCDSDLLRAEAALTLRLESMASENLIYGTLCPMSSIKLHQASPESPSHMVFVIVMVEPEVFVAYSEPCWV